MTKIFKISYIVIALFILCAPSCEDEGEAQRREEVVISETKKQIRDEFESDYLTEVELYAYEVKAKHKLSDFVDYLYIVADTSLDLSFRMKAAEMIGHIFTSQNIDVMLNYDDQGASQENDINTIIRNGLENKLALMPFTVDSIQVLELLHRTGNMNYEGKLTFTQQISNTVGSQTRQYLIDRTAAMILKKEPKVFGQDTLNIWNIRLGKIR